MENYFMFNDNIISDIFLVTKIEKPLMPSKDIQTLDVLSREGKYSMEANMLPLI